MPKKEKWHSESVWSCEKCKKTVEGINYAELQEVGAPMCPDCEKYMVFVQEVWVKYEP